MTCTQLQPLINLSVTHTLLQPLINLSAICTQLKKGSWSMISLLSPIQTQHNDKSLP
ncbi:hypothetical protein E2C01_084326 [Portunus trituberculatus]|uniref:Uncharacterized protein n=1 Tax=Portunus trituberculatus TaxID=210409 RepID=A0A5B7J4I5_PORTR|nr:hypothetical protein [Portunus trituberculatus]